MALTQLTDEAQARRFLEAALAVSSKPTLSTGQVDDLMTIATSQDEDSNDIWTAGDLNRAASIGWMWKSALVADQYDDIGGGGGKYLKQHEWKAMCMQMANHYGSGEWDVLNGSTVDAKTGIRSIHVIGTTAARDYL